MRQSHSAGFNASEWLLLINRFLLVSPDYPGSTGSKRELKREKRGEVPLSIPHRILLGLLHPLTFLDFIIQRSEAPLVY